jgi:hypothetical protein
LILRLIVGLAFGLVFGLLAGLFEGLLAGWIVGLFAGLFVGLVSGPGREMHEVRSNPGTQLFHDRIARWQHFRRQRLLKRRLLEEEWIGVPDGALSRAQQTNEPEPTQASLSRADMPEEAAPRLAAGVEAVTETEEQVAARRD